MKFLLRKLLAWLAGLEAGLISILMVILFGMFTLLFIAIWIALYIGDSMANRPVGFGIVAAIFFTLFLFAAIFRKKTVKPYVEDAIREDAETNG